jgi:hypothetical protein
MNFWSVETSRPILEPTESIAPLAALDLETWPTRLFAFWSSPY